jgi:glycosyltransferase involved in cell wall biosynthesis
VAPRKPGDTVIAPENDQTALFIGAHPPGQGSGSSVRGLMTLRGLRECCAHVDAVAFTAPDERPFAAPGVQLIERPAIPASRVEYLRTVLTSGSLYYPERKAGLVRQVANLVAAGELRRDYDVIWAHSSLMARAALNCFRARSYILDVDNVASADARKAAATIQESFPRRMVRWLDANALGREERRRMTAFPEVVVSSESELRLLSTLARPVRVVPNAVDGPDHAYDPAHGQTLLFVGNLSYDVNVDALTFLVGDVLPRIVARRPQARLVIAGRSPGEEVRALAKHPAIDLIADAPSLEPLYRAARAVVAPLRIGGGTRIKVLEAMARGTPTVLTAEAAEGLDLRDGHDAYIEREPAGFATRCEELLDDAAHASAMGRAARRRWEQHHRPEVAIERITAIVAAVGAAPPCSHDAEPVRAKSDARCAGDARC